MYFYLKAIVVMMVAVIVGFVMVRMMTMFPAHRVVVVVSVSDLYFA